MALLAIVLGLGGVVINRLVLRGWLGLSRGPAFLLGALIITVLFFGIGWLITKRHNRRPA
jgi:hypothetical protein